MKRSSKSVQKGRTVILWLNIGGMKVTLLHTNKTTSLSPPKVGVRTYQKPDIKLDYSKLYANLGKYLYCHLQFLWRLHELWTCSVVPQPLSNWAWETSANTDTLNQVMLSLRQRQIWFGRRIIPEINTVKNMNR